MLLQWNQQLIRSPTLIVLHCFLSSHAGSHVDPRIPTQLILSDLTNAYVR